MSAQDSVAAPATAQAAATTMKRWRLIALLGALSMFAPLSTDMYLPALPSMAHQLSASASAVQLTLTSCLIGLGAGQLLAGPLSDAFGRRRPVLLGLLVFTLSSAGCALANDVWTLCALRLVQGAAGAAGIVVGRAIVRDLFSGIEAARVFSRLIIVIGLAPTLAPTLGGQLLHFTDWRGIFLVLAGIGVALSLLGWRALPETLPVSARQRGGLLATLRVLGVLIRNRRFAGLTLVYGCFFGALFAYIAGSPFVLENVFSISPQLFGLIFAVNAGAMVVSSQFGVHVVGRIGPRRLATFGLHGASACGFVLLGGVLAGAGLALVLASFFVLMVSYGTVAPNITAMAMTPFPRVAGSASALMGLVQFGMGAAVAPIVGVAGPRSALPTAIVIASLVLVALVIWRTVVGRPDPDGAFGRA